MRQFAERVTFVALFGLIMNSDKLQIKSQRMHITGRRT